MRNSSQYFLFAIDVRSALALHVVNLIGAQPRDAGKRSQRLFSFALLLILTVLQGCTKTPPEQALRNTFEQMQQAGSAKDIGALMEHFGEDFVGSEGMNRDQFRHYIALIWLGHKDIGVQTGPLTVQLFDDRATVDFTLALSGGVGLIPSQGQVYQVQTGWRLEGSNWVLISATWKPTL
jgi:hypothetical protein